MLRRGREFAGVLNNDDQRTTCRDAGRTLGRAKTGADRATRTFDTQGEAEKEARRIARDQQTEVYIHGRDGRIRERTSYGRDPFPAKG